MMTEFFEEISEYMKPGESKRKFANRLGVHPSMLTYWEQGMVPKEETIERIASALRIDKEVKNQWIEWAMRNAAKSVSKTEQSSSMPVIIDAPEVRAAQRERSTAEFVAIPSVKPILVNGELCLCGKSNWFMFRQDWLDSIGSNPSNLFIKMVWEKVMEPILLSSDVVLVDRGFVEFRDGKIYAVAIDGVIHLRKMVLLSGGRIRLVTEVNHSDYIEDDPENIDILGEVVWVGRSL